MRLNALPPETDSVLPTELACTPAPEIATLEFGLDEAAASRVWRHAAVQALRAGAARTTAYNIVWHDTADGALATAGVVAGQSQARGGQWWVESLHPRPALHWPPATPAPLLETAVQAEALRLPGPLAPAAAFRGRRRTVALAWPEAPGELAVLAGDLRGMAEDQPACRLQITGPATGCAALAITLAETLAIHPPRASLAAEALALARLRSHRPRRLGAPAIPRGLTAGEALGGVAAHLADVILHWAAHVPAAATPEPVHQMRVAVRRLRSALAVFRRAAEDEAGACTWLYELGADLRDLAARLGVARDWDVFATETGAQITAAFPQERRVAQMLAAAGRKREAAHAALEAYLASQAWLSLAVRLAVLPTQRPWCAAPGAALSARDYAAHALDRRLKQLLHPGEDLSGLAAAQLHDIRKQAKRLRYATEFFGPLFAEKAVRKYLPRLESLQEALGTVNDTAVAAGLTRQLEGGMDRAFAAGVVQGFGAAKAARATAKVQRVWQKFHRAAPFW